MNWWKLSGSQLWHCIFDNKAVCQIPSCPIYAIIGLLVGEGGIGQKEILGFYFPFISCERDKGKSAHEPKAKRLELILVSLEYSMPRSISTPPWMRC